MEITRTTDLNQPAEMMGNVATRDEAQVMLDVLLEAGITDTADVSENE